jgi:hypothetical protein
MARPYGFVKHLTASASALVEHGASAAVWAPPEPAQTLYDAERGMRLVGAIEFVSPGNKDRPETRRAFVAEGAGYLQEHVALLIVDVATERQANLHQELVRLVAPRQSEVAVGPLYAVAYRARGNGHPFPVDIWPASLAIGQLLPTLPLWLADEPPIPIELETTYEETCGVLRISS